MQKRILNVNDVLSIIIQQLAKLKCTGLLGHTVWWKEELSGRESRIKKKEKDRKKEAQKTVRHWKKKEHNKHYVLNNTLFEKNMPKSAFLSKLFSLDSSVQRAQMVERLKSSLVSVFSVSRPGHPYP